MSNGEVTVYEGHPMTLAGRPADILAEAQIAAEALMGVVKKAGLSINFGGKKDHLEFEAWQTLGKFYGMTVKCIGTKFVQFGSVQGFESTSVVVDRYGEEVSRAESLCLNDEDNWKSKTKYGYLYVLKDGTKQEADPPKEQIIWVENPAKPGKKMPKREKTKMGEEAVPLFQLKSMAQTRSNAKALRNVLAWIAVLAGYAPTPAEEMSPSMEKTEENGEKKDFKQPQSKSEQPSGDMATEPQTKAVHAILGKMGVAKDLHYGYVSDKLGIEPAITTMSALTKEQASAAIKLLGDILEVVAKGKPDVA